MNPAIRPKPNYKPVGFDWAGVSPFIKSGSLILPNPKHHGIYDERFAHYRELYERLSPLFVKMAKDEGIFESVKFPG